MFEDILNEEVYETEEGELLNMENNAKVVAGDVKFIVIFYTGARSMPSVNNAYSQSEPYIFDTFEEAEKAAKNSLGTARAAFFHIYKAVAAVVPKEVPAETIKTA